MFEASVRVRALGTHLRSRGMHSPALGRIVDLIFNGSNGCLVPSFALKPSQVACSLALRGAMFTPDERGKHPCEGCGCTPFNNETGLREHLMRSKLCRKQRAIPWVPPTGDAATLCPLLDDLNAPERDYTFAVFGVQR